MRLAEDAVGRRIDRALVDGLARLGRSCTRSRLARAFAAGEVTAMGKPIKPGRVVEMPMEVHVVLRRPEPLRAEPEDLPLSIVHEDEDLLVIDKAAGMVVHAGPGHRRGTLVNAVLHHLGVGADELPVLPGNDPTRPGIVHRIDRETSGLLVVTKHERAQRAIAAQLRAHELERSYLGIVVGVPTWSERRVETRHGRDPRSRRRFSPDVDRGRRAVTTMEVQERLQAAALVRFGLETGRTHQVRMHARHVGHPILADALYGRRVNDSGLGRVAETLGRHALHAATLGFRHPKDDAFVRFEAPIPADLRRALFDLGKPS